MKLLKFLGIQPNYDFNILGICHGMQIHAFQFRFPRYIMMARGKDHPYKILTIFFQGPTFNKVHILDIWTSRGRSRDYGLKMLMTISSQIIPRTE